MPSRLLDLARRAIDLAGVGHRVAAKAIGDRLEQGRLALVARPLEQALGCLVDRQHVVAVDTLAVHPVGRRALPLLGLARGLLDGGAHAVAVVDHLEDDRQVPDRRQVERLVERADVRRALAELAEHRVRELLVAQRERGADGDRKLPADDPPPSEKVSLHVEQVHRAAVPPGDAGGLAEQLGHDAVRLGPDGDRRAVVAVAREQVVAVFERLDRSDVRGLLADREVAVATDPRTRVLLLRALLEAADQQHLAQQPLGGRAVDGNGRLLGCAHVALVCHAGVATGASQRAVATAGASARRATRRSARPRRRARRSRSRRSFAASGRPCRRSSCACRSSRAADSRSGRRP